MKEVVRHIRRKQSARTGIPCVALSIPMEMDDDKRSGCRKRGMALQRSLNVMVAPLPLLKAVRWAYSSATTLQNAQGRDPPSRRRHGRSVGVLPPAGHHGAGERHSRHSKARRAVRDAENGKAEMLPPLEGTKLLPTRLASPARTRRTPARPKRKVQGLPPRHPPRIALPTLPSAEPREGSVTGLSAPPATPRLTPDLILSRSLECVLVLWGSDSRMPVEVLGELSMSLFELHSLRRALQARPETAVDVTVTLGRGAALSLAGGAQTTHPDVSGRLLSACGKQPTERVTVKLDASTLVLAVNKLLAVLPEGAAEAFEEGADGNPFPKRILAAMKRLVEDGVLEEEEEGWVSVVSSHSRYGSGRRWMEEGKEEDGDDEAEPDATTALFSGALAGLSFGWDMEEREAMSLLNALERTPSSPNPAGWASGHLFVGRWLRERGHDPFSVRLQTKWSSLTERCRGAIYSCSHLSPHFFGWGMSELAQLEAALGARDAAVEDLRVLIACQAAVMGASHPSVAAARRRLAEVYDELGRVDEATRERENAAVFARLADLRA